MSVSGVLRIVSSIIHNEQLTQVYLDHEPSACSSSQAWRSEGLPPLPAGSRDEWNSALPHLRQVCTSLLVLCYLHLTVVVVPARRFEKNTSACCVLHQLQPWTAAACSTGRRRSRSLSAQSQSMQVELLLEACHMRTACAPDIHCAAHAARFRLTPLQLSLRASTHHVAIFSRRT